MMPKGLIVKIGLSSVLAGFLLVLPGCMFSEENQFQMHKALEKPHVVGCVIIGSGVAGLSSAIYMGRGKVQPFIIEGSKPGGMLMQTTEVENWPGERSIQGPALIEKIRNHAKDLGAEFIADSVDRIDFSSWPYAVYTESGTVIHAMSIIIATGATPAYLGIPGEQEYFGRGVGTCAVCDAAFYKDEDVVIVGGGDSAIEEAIQVAQYAKNVTILVRKDKMRAAPRMQDRIKEYESIKVRYNVEVKKVLGDDDHVTGIVLLDTQTGNTETMAINGLFLAIGHTPNSALFSSSIIKRRVADARFSVFGCDISVPKKGMLNSAATWITKKCLDGAYVETDERGYIKTRGRSQATSIPGVFVAGEVEDSRYRQAIVEAGHGVKAALDALDFLSHHGFTPAIAEEIGKKRKIEKPFKIDYKLKNIGSLEELEQLSEDSTPIILDFYTKPCVGCKIVKPIIESAAHQFAGKVRFFAVDADEASELTSKFKVTRVPYLVVLKDGEVIERYRDQSDEPIKRSELTNFIEQILAR